MSLPDRFIVVDLDEAKEYDDPEGHTDSFSDWDDWKSYLVDRKTSQVIYSDCGEPEDMTLGRNLYFFVEKLNEVSNEESV